MKKAGMTADKGTRYLAGNNQHWYAVVIGFCHGRHNIGKTGTCNYQGKTGFSGYPSKPQRHETGSTFVTTGDMPQLRVDQIIVNIQIMYTRNTEYTWGFKLLK